MGGICGITVNGSSSSTSPILLHDAFLVCFSVDWIDGLVLSLALLDITLHHICLVVALFHTVLLSVLYLVCLLVSMGSSISGVYALLGGFIVGPGVRAIGWRYSFVWFYAWYFCS